jgi:hypothetical protein
MSRASTCVLVDVTITTSAATIAMRPEIRPTTIQAMMIQAMMLMR